MLERPALREHRTWTLDSRLWSAYAPRAGDIVIATAPKCGTTWMQQIVSSLVFQDAAARSIPSVSPWIEARFRHDANTLRQLLERQTHRRFLKTHLPFDGIPLCGEVRYVHVARDGRDAALSAHNHFADFSPATLENFDRIGREDPWLARPYPRVAKDDPRQFFDAWLHAEYGPSFFALENSYWAERGRPNLLLVHYADLSADLDAEMRRIAAFLEIPVDESVWPTLVEAATFASMRSRGSELMPQLATLLDGGSERFFHRGASGRWRDVLTALDLARYDEALRANCEPALAAWIARGRSGAS